MDSATPAGAACAIKMAAITAVSRVIFKRALEDTSNSRKCCGDFALNWFVTINRFSSR